jgi:hypothetical protein
MRCYHISSEVLIASPKPPWLHLSGAKVVSKSPGACTETLSFSAYSAYIWGIWEGDRRDSNPRPSEPQSADTCFWAFPDVAQSPYLSPFPYWWLPAVSACCALSGVRSGVNYLHCGRLVFAPQGTPDCAGWLLAKAYTRNISLDDCALKRPHHSRQVLNLIVGLGR